MKKPAYAAFLVLLLSVAVQAVGQWSRLEGQHSRITERRALVVTDAAAWNRMWKEHDSSAPVPPVDFTANSVVAVFLGATRSAGVKIELVVQNDVLDSRRLNVFYKELRPASQPFAAAVICHPFAMMKVRKASVVSIEADGLAGVPENTQVVKNPLEDVKFRALLEAPASFDGR